MVAIFFSHACQQTFISDTKVCKAYCYYNINGIIKVWK